MFQSASDAAVATIAFFDQFNMALSSVEVWLYCAAYNNPQYSLSEARPVDPPRVDLYGVEQLLSVDQRVCSRNGLWMLKGREQLAEERVKRGFPVHERWAIASRAARLAAFVPFLKLFAVCNTLGYGVSKEDSDIDVFVVAQHSRLWTVRFLLTALLHITRLRRHGNRIAKRICLSFYVSTDSLGMVPLSLFPEPSLPRGSTSGGSLRGRRATIDAPDPYLAWWLGSVVPLVDHGAYADFITANQPFIERYRKTFILREPPPTVIASPVSSVIASADRCRTAPVAAKQSSTTKNRHPELVEGSRPTLTRILETLLGGFLGNALEYALRFLQLRKIRRSSAGRVRENPTSVVVSDHVLKFHENDRRAGIRDAWLARLQQLGITQDAQSVMSGLSSVIPS